MPTGGRVIAYIFNEGAENMRGKVIGLYAILGAANLAAWAWALAAFRDYPVLLGMALLSYGFGLRHAVDADHIAAIDNVTRKLMQDGKRPAAVGFFFALGHSTIVILAVFAIAVTANAFKGRFAALHGIGSLVSTLVSALFLLAIAAMNVVILVGVYRAFRRARDGGSWEDEELNMLLAGRGFLARLFRPLFGMIRHSWHMYPLGFLFGLGFDTATEVSLLGLSAAQAAHGMPIWSILVFPALFTAGMSLVDTTDGVLMLGAYGWAFVKPIRKLYYNLTITAISILVALFVGGIEALGLAADRFGLTGLFWGWIAALNDNFGTIGYAVIAIFVVSWTVSAVIYRACGYDRLEA
ncbi:MAG: HoxN/HupN/NixA family nickel/cobalt transporter [Stellaceae bacterium]